MNNPTNMDSDSPGSAGPRQHQAAAETLYNGIELPKGFPLSAEEGGREMQKPMPIPYLDNQPPVIPIDVGRQLFVDDFLIESTTLTRTYCTAEYHPNNPVLRPDEDWEFGNGGWFAAPFSGGAWYDSKDSLYKMWYTAGRLWHCALATSVDGINWDKPPLDVVEGTNIVIPANRHVASDHDEERPRSAIDTYTMWLDDDDPDSNKRYKYFATEFGHQPGYVMAYRSSADGIHWSKTVVAKNPVIEGDRSTVFYNPFRKVWVLSLRCSKCDPARARLYSENSDPEELIDVNLSNEDMKVYWVGPITLIPNTLHLSFGKRVNSTTWT